jgi:hypothetical protein
MFSPHSPGRGAFHRVDQAHMFHTGLRTLGSEQYRSWEITVAHRRVGSTVRREQYSAKISDMTARREENLGGFSSKIAAFEAARRRIDFIRDIQDPNAPRRRRRAVPKKGSNTPTDEATR